MMKVSASLLLLNVQIYLAVETWIRETEGAAVSWLAEAHVDRSFGVFDARRKYRRTVAVMQPVAVCLHKPMMSCINQPK